MSTSIATAEPRYTLDGRIKTAGQPTIRTPANRERILDAIRNGLPRKYQAASCGMHMSSLLQWLSEDAEFSEMANQAQLESVQRHLSNIASQGERDWRASERMLKWIDRETFSDTLAVDVSGELAVTGTSDSGALAAPGVADALAALGQLFLTSVQPED